MFVSRWPNTYCYHVRNWDTTSITYSRSTCWSNFLMLMYDVNVSRNWYTTSITYCCFNHALLRESLQKMLSKSGKQVNAESTWYSIRWGKMVRRIIIIDNLKIIYHIILTVFVALGLWNTYITTHTIFKQSLKHAIISSLRLIDEDYCHSTDKYYACSVWFERIVSSIKALKESRWATQEEVWTN